MEILLTKSEGIFKYVKITESYLGLIYSGTIIYFCPSKGSSQWKKAYDSLCFLSKPKGIFNRFLGKRNDIEMYQTNLQDKEDEVILNALRSVYSKVKLTACLQIENKPNESIERMVRSCTIATIDIDIIFKDEKSEVMDEFHIPLKMFVKDADSFDYYNGSSFTYTLKADEDMSEIKKGLERISSLDFVSSKE